MKEHTPSGENTRLQVRLSQSVHSHTAPVCTVRFSPDSRTLVSSDGNHLFFWEKRGRLFHHSQRVNVPSSLVRFSPGGERLAVVGTALTANPHLLSVRSVFLCDALGEEISRIPLACDASTLAFDPYNQFLAIGGSQGGVHLWGLEEHTMLLDLQVAPKRQGVSRHVSISLSDDGSLLAVGYAGLQGSAQLYTLHRFEQGGSLCTAVLKSTLVGTHISGFFVFAFSPDQRFFVAAPGGDVELYDPSSLAFITKLSTPARGHLAERDTVECLTFSPDSHYLAAATMHGMVHIWEMATFHLVTSFAAHTDMPLYPYLSSLIGDIDWSPDGRWLATSGMGWSEHDQSDDYRVKIWKVKTDGNE